MSYLFEANSFIPVAKLETRFEATEQQTGTGQSHHTGYQPLTAEFYYFQIDHLGTPLEVADSDGNLVWVGQYRAWGQLERAQDSNGELTIHCASRANTTMKKPAFTTIDSATIIPQ